MSYSDLEPTRYESPAAPLQHVRAVLLARDCLELGARVSVAQLLSGLSDAEMMRLRQEMAVPHRLGRPPLGTTWFLTKAHLFERADASLLAAVFHMVLPLARHPAEALVAAYRHYLMICPERRIGFDLAFSLTSCAGGIWQNQAYQLQLSGCIRCDGRYLTYYGDRRPDSPACPYCALERRGQCDPRVRDSYRSMDPTPDLVRWQAWLTDWVRPA